MDVFSLEEDECSQMFITQNSPKQVQNDGNNSILGDGLDFSSPLASIVKQVPRNEAQYSDISDNDFDQIRCSQQQNFAAVDNTRLVFNTVIDGFCNFEFINE